MLPSSSAQDGRGPEMATAAQLRSKGEILAYPCGESEIKGYEVGVKEGREGN